MCRLSKLKLKMKNIAFVLDADSGVGERQREAVLHCHRPRGPHSGQASLEGLFPRDRRRRLPPGRGRQAREA